MDLDELQSVQSRERQTDSLQQLRATFYQDAAEFIHSLEDERDSAAKHADDPWNSPEVGRLNDDIDTAEQTVEAIYERRVGKIVKMASLAAADMPTEDEGLTEEERELFETLVGAIEDNRDDVFAILDGDAAVDGPGTFSESAGETDSGAERTPPPPESDAGAPSGGDESEVGAADLMGSDPDVTNGQDEPEPTDVPPAPDATDGSGPEERSDGGVEPRSDDSTAADGRGPEPSDETQGSGTENSRDDETATEQSSENRPAETEAGTDESEDVDRATVRITEDVGEIFGVDKRAYELTENDVVTLPEANAGPLVESEAAERLD